MPLSKVNEQSAPFAVTFQIIYFLIFVYVGHEKIVEYLIRQGADVNAVYGVNSVERHTLLHSANFSMQYISILYSFLEVVIIYLKIVLLHSGNENMIDILIKNGANVHAVDEFQNTPLYAAAFSGRNFFNFQITC